ncbi:MAG: hypothetical protein RLZ76_664 [Bacteroidota bacterium]|jgi:lysophospholipase L1-like esterase
MKFNKIVILLSALAVIHHPSFAQKKTPFQSEIDAFKKQDSVQSLPKHPILFVGSSSFTKWKTINNDFPGYPILNRGFGGSSLTDLIHFANETIFKYKPKQVYIYCGENDLAMDASVTPGMLLERYKKLHGMIREKLGKKLPVFFISIKPSIARWKLEKTFIAANEMIKSFLQSDKYANYLDVHQPMLDDKHEVLKDIFVQDNLHMNDKGYAIWIKVIEPTLLK